MRTTNETIVLCCTVLACITITVGCARPAAHEPNTNAGDVEVPSSAFVQKDVVIVPPIKHANIQPKFDDGGTVRATLTDARGKTFVIYVDHRVGSMTKGDVYLFDYPTAKGSVHVVNQREFLEKLGNFDKDLSASF